MYYDEGFFLDCIKVGLAALKLLGEDTNDSILGLVSSIGIMQFRKMCACWRGIRRPLKEAVEEELCVRLLATVSQAAVITRKGKAGLFFAVRAINVSSGLDLSRIEDDNEREMVCMLAGAYATLAAGQFYCLLKKGGEEGRSRWQERREEERRRQEKRGEEN